MCFFSSGAIYMSEKITQLWGEFLNFLFWNPWFRKGCATATHSATTSTSSIYTFSSLPTTINSTDMPPKAKAPTSPPKFGPSSRKRTISITAEVMGNKRSRRSTRLTRDELEEEEEQKEEEEEQKEEQEEQKEEEEEREDMGMDVDVEKPAKGGRQGKKEKKGGKAAKGKRAEEKKAEEKKYVFI